MGCLGGSVSKCPTLDFGSGHDLVVHRFEPHVGLHADSAELVWDSLSLSLSLPLFAFSPLVFSFSLSLSLSK